MECDPAEIVLNHMVGKYSLFCNFLKVIPVSIIMLVFTKTRESLSLELLEPEDL